MSDDLHDRSFRTLIRALKDSQLLDQIVGVLVRETRELAVALRAIAMTAAARWNVLFGHAVLEDLLAGARLPRARRHRMLDRFLVGEVGGQSRDLVVGQVAAQPPHV